MKKVNEIKDAVTQFEKKVSDLNALKDSAETLQQWSVCKTCREQILLISQKIITLKWVLKDTEPESTK